MNPTLKLIFIALFFITSFNLSCALQANQNLVVEQPKPSTSQALPTNVAEAKPSSSAGENKIVLSTVLEQLLEKKRQNAQISSADLASFGNELIKTDGFNFAFDTCEIAEKNEKNGKMADVLKYGLKDATGKSVTFEITQKRYHAPCGCRFDFPLSKITKDKMTLVVNGKSDEYTRPKDFLLDEIELLDATMKKTIRIWYNHFDMPPVGISEDGAKVYLRTGYDDLNFKEIAVEIGEDGVPKFTVLDSPNIIKDPENLKDFPKDPNNAYRGYLKFNGKSVSYILKISYPCT